MIGCVSVVGFILGLARRCDGGGFAVRVSMLGFGSVILALKTEHSITDTSYSPN